MSSPLDDFSPPFFPPVDTNASWHATLAGTVSEGILLVGDDGRIGGVNQAACTLFGIAYPPPSGQIVGQTLLEATHLRPLTQICQAARETDTPAFLPDVALVGRQAGTRVRASAYPVPSGVLLLLTDQTELLRLQTVRTEFVANVSHELRTPLASIRATAETLLDGAMNDEPETARRFLKTIIRESDRLVRLSEDLLELSRAESETRPRRAFDLRVLVADVIARLHSQAERRQVLFHAPPAGAPINMTADRSEIDQVVFNLIDNAIKYTPAHGSVSVSLTVSAEQNTAQFTVADTGIGILSQDLPRVFERFWRADRARKFARSEDGQQTGGTGLGLSIVKHIVEAHKGVVRAESELGQGSRFIVTLPLAPPVSPPSLPPVKAELCGVQAVRGPQTPIPIS